LAIGPAAVTEARSVSTPVAVAVGGQTIPINYDLSWTGPLSGGLLPIRVVEARRTANGFVGSQTLYEGTLDLPTDASVMGTVTGTIPRNLSGTRYLLLHLDPERITPSAGQRVVVSVDSMEITVADTDLDAQHVVPDRRGWPATSPVSVSLTLANTGAVAAPPFEILAVLSADTYLSSNDTVVQTIAHAGLPPSTSETVTVSVPPTALTGEAYVGFIVDSRNAVAETNEANNIASAAIEIFDVDSGVDVAAEHIALDDRVAVIGEVVSFELQLSNRGDAMSGPFSSGVYLSSDATVTTGDTLLHGFQTSSVPAVTELAAQRVVAVVPPNLPPGDYYVALIADDGLALTDVNTANNTRVAPMTLTVAPRHGTDVNGDGAVNVLDVQLVANAIAGAGPTTGADVNADMSIDELDLVAVVNAALVD